ncbi:type II toxin-antitoxin system HicA family toxin [Nocardia sp. CA-135398]|uniref:type II toxin-antitoxin system HicA family toxin n=1 Tax=Nocardia sp. CA-135398 TaxID=3239977 RepID=UPI003D995081
MPPLPAISGDRVIKALERAGFGLIRVNGSHHMMRSPEGRFTVVPVHRGADIKPGTLRRIIRDAGMSVAEFVQLLD